MIFPKNEGGMGIRNYRNVQIATIIERIRRAWKYEGIWLDWVRKRYIIQRDLQLISSRYNDYHLETFITS